MEKQKIHSISEVTRRNIFDELRIRPVCWAGRLSELEFLSRIFDLRNLPSTDIRPSISNAEEDIWQHRVRNSDWDDDWVYTDSRFDLMYGPDEIFLRFLCEMLHPVVQNDEDEIAFFLSIFNRYLASDNWEIIPTTMISGKPVYSARRLIMGMDHSITGIEEIAKGLNANYITQQITRMQASIDSDPELALGTAKELVETCCKTILTEKGTTFDNSLDLPKLMKLTLKELSLLPEDIPEKTKGVEAIKRILRSFSNVTQGMAELRALYGTGHGKDGKSKAIEPRHAKLAVGAATTIAIFLFETFRKISESNN